MSSLVAAIQQSVPPVPSEASLVARCKKFLRIKLTPGEEELLRREQEAHKNYRPLTMRDIAMADDILDAKSRRSAPLPAPKTFPGTDYKPAVDKARLTTQFEAIVEFMIDGEWRTMQAIADTLQKKHNRYFPHGSIGSQLRNARVAGYKVEKRRIEETRGLYEYKLTRA